MMLKRTSILYAFVGLILTAIIFTYGWYKHSYLSWDIIPYISAVQMYENDSFQSVHDNTYSMLEKKIPAASYTDLCTANNYRQTCKSDPEALRQQMKFYTVKPAYNGFNYMLTKMGLKIIDALFVNTYFFSFLIYLLIFFFLISYIPRSQALMLTPIFFILSSGFEMMRIATPDTMITFFTLAAVLLAVQKKKYDASLILLLLSVFIRTDNILRYFIVLFAIWYLGKERGITTKKACIYFVLGIGSYMFHSHYFGGYSWKTLFYHTLINYLAFPANAVTNFSIVDYLFVTIKNTHSFLEPYYLLLFIPPIFILSKKSIEEIRSDKLLLFILASFIYSILHYLIFPEITWRYFYPDILITLLFFYSWIKQEKFVSYTKLRSNRQHLDVEKKS